MIEKIAVCDDDRLSREEITQFLKAYYQEKEETVTVDEYTSVEELELVWEKVRETRDISRVYDLYILDIKMQGKTGIEFMRMLENENDSAYVFFVTFYDSFMREAFGKNVCGYIKKPLDESNGDRLRKRLDWLHEYEQRGRKLTVEGIKRPKMVIDTEDIIRICSIRNGTRILLNDGDVINVRKALNVWEEELEGEDFVRISKSDILNLKYIKRITDKILMKNGEELIFTRNRARRKIIQEKFFEYVKKNIRTI